MRYQFTSALSRRASTFRHSVPDISKAMSLNTALTKSLRSVEARLSSVVIVIMSSPRPSLSDLTSREAHIGARASTGLPFAIR